MEVNHLLVGFHGEEAARHVFEKICGALIYEEVSDKIGSLNLDSFDTKIQNQRTEVIKYPTSAGNVLAVRTTQGDGGLDIIKEENNNWIVYQCKFFKDSPIDKASRKRQIEDSFTTALETAKKYGKTIVEWVLCVPLDLSNNEREVFWKNFVSFHQKDVEVIRIMPNSEISSLLIKHKHIYKHYFPSINQEINRKKMYDLLKEFNMKIMDTTCILARPGYSEKLPSLLKITDDYEILFNTYDSIFRPYKKQMHKLFGKMDETSVKAQKLKREFQTWKTPDITNLDKRTIEMQSYYREVIEAEIKKLDTLQIEIKKVIDDIVFLEETFIQ